MFAETFKTGKAPGEIVKEQGATQISDRGPIEEAVCAVLAENPEIVAKYKGGNVGVKGFVVGQAMRKTGGRANPGLVQTVVQEELDKP